MATLQTTEPFALTPVPVTSIQPGGGFCFSLELAWGRLRRRYLRLCRPGYVRRMLERRQGSCPECPHDVIDPRDLKPYRNACGYWFKPQDDAFAYRDRLGLARPGLMEVVCFSILLGSLTLASGLAGSYVHWGFFVMTAVALILWIFVLSFFRDPERAISADANVLVSPADGTITHIDEVEEPDFPGGRAFRISIFLSVFNVHVNRCPRAARVAAIRYFPGAFLDARNTASTIRNEQLWLDLEEESGRRLRVKQISGAIARRIVCWLRPSEALKTGERFGMIKFGSRTEVLLPTGESLHVQVRVGDVVHGGSTILLRL
jgi:phosphatidylserine decarboxylase